MMLNEKPLPNILSVLVTLILILAFAQSLQGQPPRAQQSQEQVTVAAHLELQGMRVKQMFLQQRGDKNYLFLRRADKNAFAIVDVTDPGHPVLTDNDVLREPAGGNVDLPAPGSALAIAFAPDSGPAASPAAADTTQTETVRLVDLTDPRHPRTVRTFNKVTGVVNDDGRKLIFLLNNEGLWIISHYRNRPLPMCTSESEIESIPDCQ